jgi:hypothetical protein
MFPLVYLIVAVIFFAAGVMMFVVMQTLFKELPHAEHISTLYVLCFGAMAFSAFLQFLGTLPGLSSLLSAFVLILSSFGFALALITPIATTVWLFHDKSKHMLRNQHRAKLVSADCH